MKGDPRGRRQTGQNLGPTGGVRSRRAVSSKFRLGRGEGTARYVGKQGVTNHVLMRKVALEERRGDISYVNALFGDAPNPPDAQCLDDRSSISISAAYSPLTIRRMRRHMGIEMNS